MADPVSIHIDDILLSFPDVPVMPSIFRIDYMKIQGSENLHDPNLVSIGPLHHGKHSVKKMEHHKFRYIKSLLIRQNEYTVNKYVLAIRSLEEQARRCYANPVEFSPNEFVQMLLLDGCFIVEFVRKYMFHQLRGDDPIFKYDQILEQLVHDLMKIENQVPFFILDQLFSMTKTGNPNDDLISLIQCVIGDIYVWPGGGLKGPKRAPEKNVDNLLDLMYTTWSSSFAEMTMAAGRCVKLDINSATELQEVGVQFEKDTSTRNILEIKFVKGVLMIPSIVVWEETESVLTNLILYEQFSKDNIRPNYLTDYALFMYCLINSSMDVKILQHRGILSNMLGNDDMLHCMFKRVSRNLFVSMNFIYADIFDEVNAHCKHRRNRWMANLRHDYFNSPWAFISFLGAIALLLLTLIQTVFSVLSYSKD